MPLIVVLVHILICDIPHTANHARRSMKLDPTNALLYFDMGVLACKTGKVRAIQEARPPCKRRCNNEVVFRRSPRRRDRSAV